MVDDFKRQVSAYVAYQNSHNRQFNAARRPKRFECGNGLIDFDVKSVKLDLTTTLEISDKVAISGEKIPVSSAVTVGGGIAISNNINNSQELIFEADLIADPEFHDQTVDLGSAPIAMALINLREALLASSQVKNRVCFHVRDDQSGDGDTYKLAVTIETDQSGNLSLGLGPINLSASADRKSATGNSITVRFGPHNFAERGHPGDRHGANNFGLPGKKSSQSTGHECSRSDPACQGTFKKNPATE